MLSFEQTLDKFHYLRDLFLLFFSQCIPCVIFYFLVFVKCENGICPFVLVLITKEI
jgi:hypothetical protein